MVSPRTHTGKARAAEAAHSPSITSLRSFCRVCRFPSFVPSCRCPVVVGAECRVRASVRPRVRPSACPSRVPSRVPRSPRTVVKDHLREKKKRNCAVHSPSHSPLQHHVLGAVLVPLPWRIRQSAQESHSVELLPARVMRRLPRRPVRRCAPTCDGTFATSSRSARATCERSLITAWQRRITSSLVCRHPGSSHRAHGVWRRKYPYESLAA